MFSDVSRDSTALYAALELLDHDCVSQSFFHQFNR